MTENALPGKSQKSCNQKMKEWKMHDMNKIENHTLENDRKSHLENERMENASHGND